MKYIQYISLVIFGLGIECPALSYQGQLTLLVEENYPHATANKETGKPEGVEVSIISELMTMAGIQYDMMMTPWNRAFRRAQFEENTCIFPINYSPERSTLFQWIKPTQTGGWAIFARPDSDIDIMHIEDISGYTIVAKAGVQAITQIEAITGQPVLAAGTDIAAAQLLHRGRADLLVSGIRDSQIAAENANLPVPKMIFNWKAAQFGLACSHNTDIAIIEALREANETRLMTIRPN